MKDLSMLPTPQVTLIHKEGRNSYGCAQSIVVGELCQRQEFGLVVLLIVAVTTEVLLQHLVSLFHLSITLWMISGSEVQSHIKGFAQQTGEAGDKLRVAVRGNMQCSMF